MNICEATKQALKEGKCIALDDFPFCKILPLEGTPCLIKRFDTVYFHPAWNPTAEDLISDNWIVVD